jgi:hypothetical protein
VLLAGVLVPGVVGDADARPFSEAAACANTSPSDFNGDGFIDAAIGDPDANVGGVTQAGVVHIRYGVAGRIGGGQESTVTQADTGESVESGDRFGSVLRSATSMVTDAPTWWSVCRRRPPARSRTRVSSR